jgi:glycosyltransferase involved in cell wall biosynthesis
MIRLAVFATHPIQYQAPLWRRLANRGRVQPVVHYFSDASVRGSVDPGFNQPVKWDVPLLDGYESVFVSRHKDVVPGLSLRLRNARSLLRRGHFDAVLVAGYVHAFEWQAVAAARRLGLGTVMRGELTDRAASWTGLARRTLRSGVLRMLYSQIDTFCYIGEQARSHLERLGVGADRQFFSPYSVDSDHFERLAASTDRAASRASLALRDEDFAVVFSGKLIDRKGIDVLADAMRRLGQQHPVVLIAVGDGPQRPLLESLRADLGAERVRIAGFVNQSDLGRYFAAGDAFVLPSRYETWGLVVNEAMYFGLPVVVTDQVGCAADLVTPQTGRVVPASRSDMLATTIAELAGDRDRARAMGLKGRERILEYSLDNTAHGVEQAASAAAAAHPR